MNLRRIIGRDNWKIIADGVRRDNDDTCCVCGLVEDYLGPRLHAHEVWDYSKPNYAILDRIIPVCESCHNLIHLERSMRLLELNAREDVWFHAYFIGINPNAWYDEWIKARNNILDACWDGISVETWARENLVYRLKYDVVTPELLEWIEENNDYPY